MRVVDRLRAQYSGLLMTVGGKIAVNAAMEGLGTPAGERKAALALFFIRRSLKVGTALTDEGVRRLAERSLSRLMASSRMTLAETAAVYAVSDPTIPVSDVVDIATINISALLPRAAAKLSDEEIAAFDLVRTELGSLERLQVEPEAVTSPGP